MHVAGVNADPATFEHVEPELVGNRRELLISELSGKGTVARARTRRGHLARRRRRRPGGGPRQGARAPRLPLRGRGRLVRAAAAKGDRRVRAAVPPGVVARDRREARRRPRRDGGDDQDLGRRRALRSHRRGQRARARARPRAARRRSSRSIPHLRDIDLVNFKVRILDETKGTDAVTRVLLDSSDGDQVWGSIGVSENVIEASWEALVDSLEYGDAGRTRDSTPQGRLGARIVTAGGVTASRASSERSRSPSRCWAQRRRSGCSRCFARAACRSGPALAQFERSVRRAHRRAARERGLQRHRRAAPGAARGRRQRRRRGHHEPVLVRGQRQRRRSTSARGRCSPTSTR